MMVDSSVSSQDRARYEEIDILRSFAILLMLAFHAAYDLEFYFGFSLNVEGVLWMAIGRVSASMFFILVGVSAAISQSRRRSVWHAMRGIVVIGLASSIVSLVTWLIDPLTFVLFGALHLIAVSRLLLLVIPRGFFSTCIMGVVIAAFSLALPSFEGSWILLPFGRPPHDFVSVDYYPLLPWFLFFLCGRFFGECFYVRHRSWRRLLLPMLPRSFLFRSLVHAFSKHALLLYMLHQPVIIGMLSLAYMFDSD